MPTKHLVAATAAAFLMSTSLAPTAANAQTQVQWWHALTGQLGEALQEIVDDFNAMQDDYRVEAIYKGNYTETMNAAIAAFRAGEQPHIVQVFEVGTATMMAARGAIYPVQDLMIDAGYDFSVDDFVAAVASYYTTTDGELLSMPFNSSTPVLWYNKDHFAAAGLDPETPPRTWDEVGEFSRQIVDSGAAACGLSFGWQSWVLVENMSAWHDEPIGTQENGFAGLDTEFVFHENAVVPRLIEQIGSWSQEGLFRYGGRRGDSLPLFTTGECSIWLNSSAYYGGIKEQADFAFGVGMLPYYDDIEAAPQNSIIGGATLWVLQGKPAEEYAAVAAFFDYLASAEVQAHWHQSTGYVPITTAAYELTLESGFYDEEPGTNISVEQLNLNPPTPNSKGLRFGNFVQIRDVINDELEAVWNGTKTAKQALEDAAAAGNTLLRRFEDANAS